MIKNIKSQKVLKEKKNLLTSCIPVGILIYIPIVI